MESTTVGWMMYCLLGSLVLMIVGTVAVVFFTDAAIWLKWSLMFVWAFYLAFLGRMIAL